MPSDPTNPHNRKCRSYEHSICPCLDSFCFWNRTHSSHLPLHRIWRDKDELLSYRLIFNNWCMHNFLHLLNRLRKSIFLLTVLPSILDNYPTDWNQNGHIVPHICMSYCSQHNPVTGLKQARGSNSLLNIVHNHLCHHERRYLKEFSHLVQNKLYQKPILRKGNSLRQRHSLHSRT